MTSPPSQFPSINYLRDVIEEDLKTTCASLKGYRAESIAEVLSYHLGWTEGSDQNMGKRIRPLLTLLSCSAVGGEWTTALPVSSSIELIHNFSLIHDDIEDGSETRRGMTTVWKRWGIPRAINIGDAVFILARLSAHRMRDHSVPAEIILQLFEILDQACLHLTIGQDMDLTFETREDVTEDEYLKMIEGKTSALLAAATSCGGVVAQANSNLVETLRVFGHHLGLAFQIRDEKLENQAETISAPGRKPSRSFTVLAVHPNSRHCGSQAKLTLTRSIPCVRSWIKLGYVPTLKLNRRSTQKSPLRLSTRYRISILHWSKSRHWLPIW
jgi:geranylgeranyl pyrophosphate synthase